MDIDFTKLENIARNGENGTKKQVSPYKDTPKQENALNQPTTAKNGIDKISKVRLNKEQENNAKTAEMYGFYQENISRSQTMTAELLKGVQAGEDQALLLLKATKIISMMTGNELIYNQMEADLKSIYGAGLLEPYPLELELKQIQERLNRLQEAEQRPGEPEENRKRIKNAITAHQKRKKQITLLLSEAI
jgi:hypothetical protein